MMQDDYKQVIAVRSDLKLSRGKLSVQVAHASIDAYRKADAKVRSAWEASGSKKVVVRAESLKGLMEIYEEARQLKLPCALIRDAGRTEILPGTETAVGIGPCRGRDIDKVTGKLKML
jgi:PTH2 family peptidyl-tRNA hydrolase